MFLHTKWPEYTDDAKLVLATTVFILENQSNCVDQEVQESEEREKEQNEHHFNKITNAHFLIAKKDQLLPRTLDGRPMRPLSINKVRLIPLCLQVPHKRGAPHRHLDPVNVV